MTGVSLTMADKQSLFNINKQHQSTFICQFDILRLNWGGCGLRNGANSLIKIRMGSVGVTAVVNGQVSSDGIECQRQAFKEQSTLNSFDLYEYLLSWLGFAVVKVSALGGIPVSAPSLVRRSPWLWIVQGNPFANPLLNFLTLQKYRITKRVGGGSFGDIYLGVGANGEKVGQCRDR